MKQKGGASNTNAMPADAKDAPANEEQAEVEGHHVSRRVCAYVS